MPDAVHSRLDHWKRQLIDLSKRNRLLNFKPTRVTTIQIVDELPTEVFRTLQLDRRAMTFLPLPEQPLQPSLLDNTASGEHAPRRIVMDSTEFRVQDRTELPSHHTDTSLQTNLSAERLETNLLRIFQNSTGLFEDQGVNSLFLALGMVEWYEADDSNVALRAPLVLLPVQLVRQTARGTFSLRTTDDDPVLNPALVEKLRLDFRITLPEMPETSEDFNPEEYLASVQQVISVRKRWRVTNDIVLGLFTFQKFVMYRDMEINEQHYATHPVVHTLCTGKGERLGQLSRDVVEARLDEVFTPETTYQVLDADSSQQRALLAVKSGRDLALEGPPGTGKSQTIANMIASALADGRSVLFVSEKLAALQVVYGRLETLGLHDYCLELHSNKTNKRAVIAELARVLDSPQALNYGDDSQLERLPVLRDQLNGYASELHEPFGKLAASPYQILGEFVRLDSAPVINAEVASGNAGIADVDRHTFVRTCGDLAEHAQLLREIGDPEAHPWRGSTLRRIGDAERDLLQEAVDRAALHASNLSLAASILAEEIGATVPHTFGQVEVLCDVARSLARSPRTSESLLRNERWNSLSADVAQVLAHGQQYEATYATVAKNFQPQLLDSDFGDLVDHYKNDYGSWLRYFRPGFWKDRRTLRAHARPGYQDHDIDIVGDDLTTALQCRSALLAIRANDALGRELFGDRWHGTESDWEELRRFADWIVSVRRFVIEEALQAKGIALAATGQLDAEYVRARVQTLQQLLITTRKDIDDVGRLGGLADLSTAASSDLAVISQRLSELRTGIASIRTWAFYQASLRHCSEGLAGPVLRRFYEDKLVPELLEPAFRRAFYRRWLDSVGAERPRLAYFRTLRHEEVINEFRRLDVQALDIVRRRALHRLSRGRDRLIADPELALEVRTVQRELRKRTRFMPLRQLLRRAPNAIRLIKPCFMMSPLSVAQFLDPGIHRFDLVVFDEASQIAPEDAIGAIVHGRQVVVVGDSKQLPPTNFFSAQVTSPDDLDPTQEEDLTITDDLESILDEFVTTGFPRWRLRWHYRSQHESLIAFSNKRFYDGELLTFPGPETGIGDRGLRFDWIGGTYEGKGINPMEARAVADAVCEHIRTHPELSLGVGTFNIKQQTLILDELDNRRRADPSLEFFFARKGEDQFFVKNLENIQGDDRDVIFLSVTYGPDAQGRVRFNFGPINGSNGWRRLNVILTRAKRSLRVFSSMRGEQIDPTHAQSDGARLLRDYLLFAERGLLSVPVVDPEAEMDSPFERAVYQELTQRGLRLVPQVGQAGYRIDFGVLDDTIPGRFVAGIECDGATYHSAATARDRDRLRQQILEGLGWHIHRIWSTDWYHDQGAQIERILKLVEESRQAIRIEQEERRGNRGSWLESTDPPHDTSGSVPSVRDEDEHPADGGDATQIRTDTTQEPVSPPTIPRYTFTPVSILGAPEDFYLAPTSTIADVLLQVVNQEAPIHLTEATRRVATFWQMSRAGSRIRDRIERIAWTLNLQGEVELGGDFLWRKDQREIPIRSRAIPGYSFDTDYICPEEFDAAIIFALRTNGPRMKEELTTEVARLMGFERTGHKLSQQISAGVQRLVENGELRIVATGIQIIDARGG